ncbi:tRNA wybutosine-synthesizing protein 2/3/4-like [Silene latifolia]|uniref:tRNA wybutosine-synthesizing protein 2/3/4-like n=1 Tax=Silene latifolia TaxID=37657 RepID=UPI003D76A6B1
MEFEKRKAATMAAISSTSPDKSPKGNIDAPIIPLLSAINSHPSYFTTSSCSGRISIFSHKPNSSKGGTWAFISHEPVDSNPVLDLIFPPNQTESTQPESGELVFRFEPLIIAIECRDVGSAQFMVSLAISCGFRESGITSVSGKRVIIAIRCSIRMEVPLGCKGRIMVSRDYLRYLVEVANDKMGANWKRTQGFMEGLRNNGFSEPNSVVEAENALVVSRGDNGGGVGEEDLLLHLDVDDGPLENYRISLAVVPMEIVGEPADRLFLWGHSTCPISNSNKNEVLIYGGFGGIGRHARRSDCLRFDPSSCRLTVMPVKGCPSPRLGHTSSVVGDSMIVIGGRADPANILSEVWIFDFVETEWKLVSDPSNAFTPRHRHAAAVIGSKIYLFGGLNESMLYSSLLLLDVATMLWTDVHASGEWPSARHSHSLVAHGQKLYLFGGYDGEKALGDLYSFDIEECQWMKVKTLGRSPYPRFSQSMFIYKEYLGIIGGCPVRQHSQELSLLDLNTFSWKHVILDSVGKELFVRSTANVIGDDLVMIGGGASCYAFGTKFSEPTMINMLPLLKLADSRGYQNSKLQVDTDLNLDKKEIRRDVGDAIENAYWVLKLNKKYAKPGKDILKKFGWLDPSRKVNSNGDGSCIYFPVTTKFCALFSDELIQTARMIEGFGDLNLCKTSIDSCSKALDLLVAFGATKYIDEFVSMKKTLLSPLQAMKETVALLLKKRGLSEEILDQLPTRWERLGDIAVLPITSFRDPAWDTLGMELWDAVAKTLGAHRLARQGRVASTGTRDSRLEILVGDSGWVHHRENGIIYCFDVTKCMFSWGNLSEKLRMARIDCRDEVIVDLFAGIGYFTLPFLVRGHAKLVYACEWNPHAVEALRHNLEANLASDRCIVLEGDNRLTAPKGVANRVCLGLLPSSEGSWVVAVRALRSEGGTLHIHMNVKDSEETEWTQHVVKSISEIAESEGRFWKVSMVHLERVKWYAPHIRHVVADISCENIQGGSDQVI